MGSEEEKKGFTVRDRRVSTQPSEAKGEEQKEAERTSAKEFRGGKGEDRGRGEEIPLSEINFSSFVLSLSTSALMHLGEVPDPTTQKLEKDLPLAKQSIDILGVLKEKTRGNLTPDEEKLLENLLADLRWRYIRETKA